jgi:F-type H+-transporting ATPase subunit a
MWFAAAAIDPFEEVVDTTNWVFFHTSHHVYHLPFGLTKYMVLELIVASLILLIYIPLARKVQSGQPVKGAFWNAWEALLTFVRDNVAKPRIGAEADQFVPFLWTLFLFVLFSNLLGVFPFMGSPTASIYVTGALALITFCYLHFKAIVALGKQELSGGHGHGHGGHGDHGPAHGAADAHAPATAAITPSAIASAGFIRHLKNHVPHLSGVPWYINIFLIPMITGLEVAGEFIRAIVLAIRLFANLLAGHTVLGMLLLFIVLAKDMGLFASGPITAISVLAATALSMLELFVAFLQAFIFVFLTSLYIGGALHPAH